MALSAADLQKRHELEGAPDPFPSLATSVPISRPKQVKETALDTESEEAFPSLPIAAPSPASTASGSVWGTPRIKALAKAPVFTESFTLPSVDPTAHVKDGKTVSLGDAIKQVTLKHKVKVEASANQKSRQTTFLIRSESQKELEKAKRTLIAVLSPVIEHIVNAPASTISIIIGPKGANLNKIREQTNVRIDIPKREQTTNGTGANTPEPNDEDDEEPIVAIKVTGPKTSVLEAEALIKQYIASKVRKSTQRIRDVPAHVLPFIIARRPFFLAAAGEEINLALNSVTQEITVNGEREAVGRAVDAIKQAIDSLTASLTSIKLTLSKSQQRLLVGPGATAVLSKSNCVVIVPENGDEVAVWGEGANLATGLTAVMEQANSKHVASVVFPGPAAFSKQLVTYFQRIHYEKTLSWEDPNVQAFLPSPEASTIAIDLIGDKPDVDAATKKIKDFIGRLVGGTRDVSVDWLLHRVIAGKNVKKLKQLRDAHNVNVYFAAENSEVSNILLVYDPLGANASLSPDEKKKRLDEVEKELLKLAKEAADVKTETISVEKRWHDAVVGVNNTTLNAIVGEDITLSIKLGADAGVAGNEDVIVVHGVSSDVDRAVKAILNIVESAKNDEIINSYFTEFEIEREYVGRVVGAQGSGVNKLRDQLGVRIDVSDETDDNSKEFKKASKKSAHQKSKFKITGRKENVEDAKKRILAQVDRLADETSEILKIPAEHHSSLIGSGGKYAIRLEEKYDVKITFPRQGSDSGEGRTREHLKADEVLIKGGKKGVAHAKSEILEALEVEKENNHSTKFTVPTRSVARILGRGGASINEIKDTTGAQIDFEKNEESGPTTAVTLRGTKGAIAAAKTAILAIADQVTEETTVNLTIESKFHRTIIGPGGQGLRDLIGRCGGPTDPKLQAGLVRFPRQGEPSDDVRLRGEPKLVAKVQVELEQLVAKLRDRVVLAVEVPAAQHRLLIGRGGQHLIEKQDKFDVQIQFPGSRSYNQVGEPENAAELADVEPANIVKVVGSREACEKAIAELKSNVKAAPVEGPSTTVEVLLKYANAISQQGNFFRSLRAYGVQVDQSQQPSSNGLPARPTPTARIDDESAAEYEWEVIENTHSGEDGTTTWTLKARDEAGLSRAQNAINDAIAEVKRQSHVGFLTLPDRSVFPRIVGAKGATVARLRSETGADITVSRDNNTITIVGSEQTIDAAKDAILRLISNQNRSRRND